jgi:hypothetical protein
MLSYSKINKNFDFIKKLNQMQILNQKNLLNVELYYSTPYSLTTNYIYNKLNNLLISNIIGFYATTLKCIRACILLLSRQASKFYKLKYLKQFKFLYYKHTNYVKLL